MNWNDLPLMLYGITLVALAMLLAYWNLDGFAHTILGVLAGYFFHYAYSSDKQTSTLLTVPLSNTTLNNNVVTPN